MLLKGKVMLKKSKEEIEQFVVEVFPPRKYDYQEVEISVEPAKITILVSRMYAAVPLSFEILTKFSKFFDTMEINENSFGQPGCDTCDYGSKYSIELTIK
jgi:hypothetical protein